MAGAEKRLALGITEHQANALLDALYAKTAETDHYLSSYPKDGPRETDTCCDAHLARFQERARQRESLLERKAQVKELIALIEALEPPFDAQPSLDPFAPVDGEPPITWEANCDEGVSPAEAAKRVWRRFFRRGHLQPSSDEGCVFTVSVGDRKAVIDLSEERYAHLFDD